MKRNGHPLVEFGGQSHRFGLRPPTCVKARDQEPPFMYEIVLLPGRLLAMLGPMGRLLNVELSLSLSLSLVGCGSGGDPKGQASAAQTGSTTRDGATDADATDGGTNLTADATQGDDDSTGDPPPPPPIATCIPGNGTIFHVALKGDDDVGDGTEASPFRTINRAVSVLGPGDTVNIHAGTYTDDTTDNPYVPSVDVGQRVVSVGATLSGTQDAPITLRAHPGDEGSVILDNESQRMGIHALSYDYWQICGLRIVNSRDAGITSYQQIPMDAFDTDRASIGWLVENNYIGQTSGPPGSNVSGIAPWGSHQWTVRNNHIQDVTREESGGASCMQVYGVSEILVENNRMEACALGVFWKDHHVLDAMTREKISESEIRFNRIYASRRGVVTGIRGSFSTEAGLNYWHHNIVIGATEGGMRPDTAGAGDDDPPNDIDPVRYTSGTARIEHNIIDGLDSGFGVVASATDGVILRGNIFVRLTDVLRYQFDTGELTESDYNVVPPQARFVVNVYGNGTGEYLFKDWRGAIGMSDGGAHTTLGTSNPDTNSIIAQTEQLFMDIDSGDYRSSKDSPAVGLMPDGSNAGAYQSGDEIIGLLPSYSAGE